MHVKTQLSNYLRSTTMGAIFSVLGGLSSAGSAVSSYAVQGVSVAGNLFLELGSYACSGFTLAFACITGCWAKSTAEALRPITDYDESELKKVDRGRCCLSCFLAFCFIFWSTFIAIWIFNIPYGEADER